MADKRRDVGQAVQAVSFALRQTVGVVGGVDLRGTYCLHQFSTVSASGGTRLNDGKDEATSAELLYALL